MKLLKYKKSISAVVGTAMVAMLAACGSTASNGDASGSGKDNGTVKIGAILSFSGPFAELGESNKNGFSIYLDQHKNMLGNHKVEIKYEDSAGDPKKALTKYRQLVKGEKVDLLMGPILSSEANALVDQVVKDKIVLISPNAAANAISWEKKNDYVYRVDNSDWQNGHAASGYIAQNIGKKAVAIAPDYVAGQEVMDAFKSGFEKAGGKVLEEMKPKLGTTDYATYLTEIKKLNPDVVYAFLSGSDAINFIKQYNSFGLKGKISLTGAMELGDELVTQPTGSDSEGVIAGVTYTPYLDNEVNKKFVEDYKAKFKKNPNIFAVEGYDSAQIIDKALKKAGSVKSADLVKVLKGLTFDSPRGSITLDPKTNNPIQDYYITKNVMKDGEIVPEVLQTIKKVQMPASPTK